jgi:hypothetical protein
MVSARPVVRLGQVANPEIADEWNAFADEYRDASIEALGEGHGHGNRHAHTVSQGVQIFNGKGSQKIGETDLSCSRLGVNVSIMKIVCDGYKR